MARHITHRPHRLSKASIGLIAALVLTACGPFGGAKVDTDKSAAAVTAGLKAQAHGDNATALDKFNEALKYNPQNTYALYNKAVLDFIAGRTADAEAGYREALRVNPAYEPAMYNLAVLEQIKGDDKSALALYQRAVQADPSDARAHFNLALMLRATDGYAEDGDAQMKIALRLDPSLNDPLKQDAGQ